MSTLDKRLAALLEESPNETGTSGTQLPIALNQEQQKYISEESDQLVPVEITDETDRQDKELARAAMRSVLGNLHSNLGNLIQIANGSEHPRAYEVAATMAKTIIDAATKLHDMVDQKQHKNSSNGAVTGDGNTITQQNVYLTSAEDVTRLLRERREAANNILDTE